MRIIVFLIVASVLNAAPAMAQGNTRDFGRDSPARQMQKYFAQVQKEVYEGVLLRWRSAAERDDATALAKLYAENASYFPPAADVVQTRPAIRDYFTTFLPTVLGVEVRLIDFGMSGELAYVTTGISFQTQTENGQKRQINRTDMIVLRRHSYGEWQIETHLSREEPQSSPTHPAAGD